MRLEHVDWHDPRAVALRDAMNAETGALYAEVTESRTAEQNAVVDEALAVDPQEIVATVLVLDGEEPVGHAALRPYSDSLEVKKVFVSAGHRGLGVARLLMGELERVARERGAASLMLQTGDRQVPAIRLYEDLGYRSIPVYGRYTAMSNALCYEKVL